MPKMWYIISDRTIVTIASYYTILRTIPLAINTMIEGSSIKFLTILERRRFKSIATSWAVIPNTNLGLLAMVALGHLWYNLGTYFVGSISAAPLGTLLDARSIRTLTCPWPHTGSPHILTTSSVRTLTKRGPT